MRWPYKWRKVEGRRSIIPKIGKWIYKWDCFVENLYIKKSKLPQNGVNQEETREKKVIVSLTSFPGRINECYYAIKSLMLQDYKADKIILWLAESQFPDRVLPDCYKDLTNRGLEIRYCEDLRSHKKYYYVLQEQKTDELVVTFDDDIIYEKDAILKLVQMHKKFPDCVICNRAHYMTSANGELNAYSKWKTYSDEGVATPSIKILPSTGAGCLYPYGIMPEITFDFEMAKKYAFTADDIWMCFTRMLAGKSAVKTRKKNAILCNVKNSQKEALTNINDLGNGNQNTIDALLEAFPQIKEYFRE